MAKKKKAPRKASKKASPSAPKARRTTAARHAPKTVRKTAPTQARRKAPVKTAAKKTTRKPTTYTITILSVPASPELDYTIDPPNNAKKTKVKHGDTVQWQSPDGDWTVTFPGGSPFEGGVGDPATPLTGAQNSPPVGGIVSKKTLANAKFKYDVVLMVGNERKSEDPEIIIDSDPDGKKTKKPRSPE